MSGFQSGAQNLAPSLLHSNVPELRPGLKAQLDLLLSSGGGDDIWPDPATGRTRLGALPSPAQHEIWFSSTSFSNISPHGYKAAGAALESIVPGGEQPAIALGGWFDEMRERIVELYGVAGSEAVLLSSPRDGEELALAAASCVLKREIAPVSTMGCFIGHELVADYVNPYNGHGEARELADVLEDCVRRVDGFLTTGRAILMHIDHASASTNLPLAIAMLAPLRTMILVDASDLRCSRAMIRRHLAQGFMVMISGSQFAAGPHYCGALLLPPDIVDRLAKEAAIEPKNECASFDFSRTLRGWVSEYSSVANLGLGLRWSAALAELERYFATPFTLRRQIVEHFDRKLASRVALCDFVTLSGSVDEPRNIWDKSQAHLMLPAEATLKDARDIVKRLRECTTAAEGDAVCHLGQPVELGARVALSASINTSHIADIASRMNRGLTFERAFAPISRDIDTLLRKWERIVEPAPQSDS